MARATNTHYPLHDRAFKFPFVPLVVVAGPGNQMMPRQPLFPVADRAFPVHGATLSHESSVRTRFSPPRPSGQRRADVPPRTIVFVIEILAGSLCLARLNAGTFYGDGFFARSFFKKKSILVCAVGSRTRFLRFEAPEAIRFVVRILFFNEAAAAVQGEMNQYVLDVAARLQAAGDTVALVHSRTKKVGFPGTRYVFEHLQTISRQVQDVRARLEAIVGDFNPDVIQIHGVPNTQLDPWLALLAPTVRFIHDHSFYCSGGNMTWQLPRKACTLPHTRSCFFHHVAHRCGPVNGIDNVIAYRQVSGRIAALKSLHGVQVATRMIGRNLERNGFSPEFITHLPLYAPPPKSKPPRTGGHRIVLHSGGLSKKQGVRLLAENIGNLPSDVDLVFAGSGPLEGWLERFAHNRGLTERIRVMGDLGPAELGRLHHSATILAMPSMWNVPLGLSGLYAMAHGKPVIAFQSDGIGEWIRDGETGICVKFGDRAAFITKLRDALGDPARLAAMGEAGRKRWEAEFRPAPHVKRLREYYARIEKSARL